MLLTLGDLRKIWGEPIGLTPPNLDTILGTVCTDSRKIIKGDFFIPLSPCHTSGREHGQTLLCE